MKFQIFWMMPHTKRLLEVKTFLFIATAYSIAISVLFFMPTGELPKVDFSAADKLVHGLIYFILINLWAAFFYLKKNLHFNINWASILFFSILLYGIIIEILQGLFTASRIADIFDVLANLIGSLLGILFFKSIKKYINI